MGIVNGIPQVHKAHMNIQKGETTRLTYDLIQRANIRFARQMDSHLDTQQFMRKFHGNSDKSETHVLEFKSH